jgi:hypothetical protein
MTTAGWLFMSLSISAVLTLVVFCYRQVLREPDAGGAGPSGPAEHAPEDLTS